jgi:hypothetical protein
MKINQSSKIKSQNYNLKLKTVKVALDFNIWFLALRFAF